MSRLGTYLSACLEWQIILINVLGIASFKNWYREREKSEVENISNLQLLQYDGKDSWYKTILLWITNVRFVIDRIKIFACASNIVTIFAQSWRYLLIPWMLLSFIQDVLEIVIIVTMSLLWYEKNVPTLKFVEFIVEKLVWIVISSYEWYTTLKWYMQLRKAEKLRKLTIIARRSIADIFQVPGRVGHSLDDELLAIAEARRDRYASTASLLNLNSLSMESSRGNFELRVSKSLSTKISDNSRESNNSKDSVANDLSAAEKSMKMLNVTAEDVMDARARIQEKSFYWSEQNVSQKMFEAMEEVILEQEKEEINNEFMKNEQIATNNRKEATNSTSRKEVNVKNSLTEKDDRKKTLVEKKKAKKTETKYQCNQNAMLQGTKIENSEIAEKFVQCPSKNEKNMNFQLSTSLVKKTEAKLDSNSASREKWIDLNNQKEHSRDVETKKLTPTDSNNDRKEKRYKDLRMSSCEFHRAMYTNGSCIGSAADDNVKDVKDDVDKKEAKRFVSCVNTQRREKLNGHSRLNYSEIYRLKKQIQKSNESCGKQPNTWGSKSLAETARPSGYAKHFVATDRSRFICQNAQTEIFDKSDDSSNVRSKMKQIGRIENNRSVELHSVYNRISLKRKNYVKSEEHEAELLISDNNLALLKDKKARKKRVLSPKKLSIEKCEAIERTALRAYNELTLLEDKKRLETKKKRDLNCEQSMEKLNAPERQVYEDLILLRDNQEMETIKRHNLSPSCEQSNKESIASQFRDELTFLADKKEESGTLSNSEENVKVSTGTNQHFPESNHEENVNCSSLETHENANSLEENDRVARRRHRLNLREITRNIEWTVHPEGIVLANKNLRSQVSNERLRERQRDIVDDNTASMLHSAFFFKPEIITRIFRHAQSTTNESFSTVALRRRQDLSTNFVCRVNNEVIVRDQNTLFGLDFDQMMGRNDGLGCLLFSNVDIDNDNADNNRVTGEESSRNSYAISIELEQIVPESDIIVSTENSEVEPQEDILTASNLVQFDVFEEENVVINNSPFQFVTDISRNIDVEENFLGCTSSEQLDDREMNNVILDYDFRPENFSTNDTISNKENDTKRDRSLLDRSANIDEIIDDLSKQVLDSSNDHSDDNTSSVNSIEQNNLHLRSLDDKYLNKTNFHFENNTYKNNLFHKRSDNNATLQLSDNNHTNNNNNNNDNNTLLNTAINKAKISMFNHNLEKSSKLSFSHPSSFIESNCLASIVRSSDENLQKPTQLLNNKVMIKNENSRSINSEANDDANLQFWTLDNVKFATETRDVARSENKVTDFYETTKEIPATGFFEMNSEQLMQDDSFYSTYEKDDKSETQILWEEGSLMEEFSDDTIPPGMSSFL